MVELEDSDLLELHKIVEERFSIFKGVKDLGLLKAISLRPSQKIHAGYEPYDTVFKKAASLMEGVIRMHPFYDGNKRTGLLAAICYLEANGYSIVVPLSAVRYTVIIAKKEANDPKSNAKLIKQITKWLKKHCAKPNSRMLKLKDSFYVKLPILGLFVLAKGKWGQKYVYVTLSQWLAFDIYPEYAKETKEVANFISDLARRQSVWDLLKKSE